MFLRSPNFYVKNMCIVQNIQFVTIMRPVPFALLGSLTERFSE